MKENTMRCPNCNKSTARKGQHVSKTQKFTCASATTGRKHAPASDHFSRSEISTFSFDSDSYGGSGTYDSGYGGSSGSSGSGSSYDSSGGFSGGDY